MQLEVEVRAHREALLHVTLDGRTVLEVGARQVVLRLVGAAVDGHITLEGRTRVVEHVEPVGIGRRILVQLVILIGEGLGVEPGIGVGLAGQLHKLLGVEHLRRRRAVDVGNAILHAHRHVGLTLAPLLRRDEYHAIAAVGTIDRGGGGILQHGDALDIVGVQKRQRTDRVVLSGHEVGRAASEHRHSVDHPQRFAAGRQRALAAHAHIKARTRVVGRVAVDVDLHTRHQSVEHRVETPLRQVLELLRAHLIGRAHQVAALLHRAVGPYYHDVLNLTRVLLHRHFLFGATADTACQHLHTYVTIGQRGWQRPLDGHHVTPVEVGHGHVLSVLLLHGDAYQRVAMHVDDQSAHHDVVSLRGDSHRQSREKEQAFQYSHNISG